MNRKDRARLLGALVVMFSTSLVVFGDSNRKGRQYEDEDYGLKVAYPADGWKRGYPGVPFVPGELCRIWSSGPTASIALFVQKPGGPVTPRFLLDESAKSLSQSFSAQVRKPEIRRVDGMYAATLLLYGRGTGAAMEPSGEMPTTQRWVWIPREEDIVVLLLSAADSEFRRAEEVFEDMLKSVKIEGKQTDEQRESK